MPEEHEGVRWGAVLIARLHMQEDPGVRCDCRPCREVLNAVALQMRTSVAAAFEIVSRKMGELCPPTRF